jgi:hypothetical protein
LKRHRRAHAGFLIGAALLLGACAQQQPPEATAASEDSGVNAYPTSYKADILAAMHAYLNDPTGVRDGAISEPALKPSGSTPALSFTAPPTHYVVCVRFNAKQNGNNYGGVRDLAAVFIAGRFDRFIERPKELCADAAYTPFPELGQLSR